MFLFYLLGLGKSRCVVTSSWVRPDIWHRFPKSYITKFSSLKFSKYFNFKNIKYISSMIVCGKRWQAKNYAHLQSSLKYDCLKIILINYQWTRLKVLIKIWTRIFWLILSCFSIFNKLSNVISFHFFQIISEYLWYRY